MYIIHHVYHQNLLKFKPQQNEEVARLYHATKLYVLQAFSSSFFFFFNDCAFLKFMWTCFWNKLGDKCQTSIEDVTIYHVGGTFLCNNPLAFPSPFCLISCTWRYFERVYAPWREVKFSIVNMKTQWSILKLVNFYQNLVLTLKMTLEILNLYIGVQWNELPPNL